MNLLVADRQELAQQVYPQPYGSPILLSSPMEIAIVGLSAYPDSPTIGSGREGQLATEAYSNKSDLRDSTVTPLNPNILSRNRKDVLLQSETQQVHLTADNTTKMCSMGTCSESWHRRT